MQIIDHKKTNLTISQKFFIEKSLELLYIGSIDSYRVKLNNPKTILEELKYCLVEFEKGRIKHFHTIKSNGKTGKAIVDEVNALLLLNPSYLKFDSISIDYLLILLKGLNEHNYKSVISSIKILLKENEDYLERVVSGIEELVKANDSSFENLCRIDISLNNLFSTLINKGFSKGFLYKIVYGIFVHSLKNDNSFDEHFENFKLRVLGDEVTYTVVFRIDTTQTVYDAMSNIPVPEILLTDNINDINLRPGVVKKELDVFNVILDKRKFIRCEVKAFDYLKALKAGKRYLSEYLDVLNLGLSGESIHIHNRVLVIDQRSPERGKFQNNISVLDGKYRVEQDHYTTFTTKLPSILNNDNILPETKEKIKSAVRYLRLGNQTTEIEHKFINYWIGLEYLFSNYESSNTINRLKIHFINAHALAYLKRNVHNFKKSFSQLSNDQRSIAPTYTILDNEYLKDSQFYKDISSNLQNEFPLLAYRAMKLNEWFFEPSKAANAKKYLQRHKDNLEVHFTRIYRLRNEIIHDAAMNTNNQLIVSNLRYYLTFILNEIIDFLSNSDVNLSSSIEDYFILNELRLGNIEQNGSLLNDLLEVQCSIDFIS